MIDFAKARALAEDKLRTMNQAIPDDEIIIQDDRTIERDFGWVFFYQSKEFLERRNWTSRLLGNAPIIVDKMDGSLHFTGTAKPIDEYIREYEKKRQYRS